MFLLICFNFSYPKTKYLKYKHNNKLLHFQSVLSSSHNFPWKKVSIHTGLKKTIDTNILIVNKNVYNTLYMNFIDKKCLNIGYINIVF